MRRPSRWRWLALAACGNGVLGVMVWMHGGSAPVTATISPVAAPTAKPSPDVPVQRAPAGASMHESTNLPASSNDVAASSAASRMPTSTATVAATPSVRDFIEHGDPRSPPLAPEAAQELPTAEELADPEAYHRYEARQNSGIVLAFASAAVQALQQMRSDIERARKMGATAEQLREAEDKQQHLQEVLQRIDTKTGELH